MKTLGLILACTLTISGQQNLPTYDTIERIKTYARVYVASDNQDSRKRIIKALGKDKALETVNSPDDAQFFIEYSELGRDVAVSGERTRERQERGQMIVFVIGSDKRKVIVWSANRSRDTEQFLGMKMYDSGRNESELTSRFLKALKKARG